MQPEIIRTTRHYQTRAAERALRSNVEGFIMRWGTETRAAGASHITVVLRHLPPELRDTEEAVKAKGWIIVLNDNGELVTCYRRRDAWRFVRRKSGLRPHRRRHWQ